ncbi:hypothetical protein EXIGLDRAFT_59894 [Exidia glandulosa HHB12029]|uniref:Uncharacterized protein n=1 Tax=Exidia glandulosa HHB12029 TaxID=1314781 RepID=A0A166MLY2_EXIGL|nr:hypothetical protein EXIGLDRAFT_59894 [Exidia glandulosa HHB12029]
MRVEDLYLQSRARCLPAHGMAVPAASQSVRMIPPPEFFQVVCQACPTLFYRNDKPGPPNSLSLSATARTAGCN